MQSCHESFPFRFEDLTVSDLQVLHSSELYSKLQSCQSIKLNLPLRATQSRACNHTLQILLYFIMHFIDYDNKTFICVSLSLYVFICMSICECLVNRARFLVVHHCDSILNTSFLFDHIL